MSNQICSKHGRQNVFFDKQQSDPKLQYLCVQCITELRSNWILIEALQEKLNELKNQVLEEKKILFQKNMKILQDLKQNLFDLKEQLTNTLSKYIIFCDQQIEIITNSENRYGKEIENLPTSDFDSFIFQFQQIESKFINYSDIRELLKKNLMNISTEYFTKKIQEIIIKFIEGLQSFKNETISQFKTQLLQTVQQEQLALKCKTHSECSILERKILFFFSKINESFISSMS